MLRPGAAWRLGFDLITGRGAIFVTAGGIALSVDFLCLGKQDRLSVLQRVVRHQEIAAGLGMDGFFAQPEILPKGGILDVIQIRLFFHNRRIVVDLPLNDSRDRDLIVLAVDRADLHAGPLGQVFELRQIDTVLSGTVGIENGKAPGVGLLPLEQ